MSCHSFPPVLVTHHRRSSCDLTSSVYSCACWIVLRALHFIFPLLSSPITPKGRKQLSVSAPLSHNLFFFFNSLTSVCLHAGHSFKPYLSGCCFIESQPVRMSVLYPWLVTATIVLNRRLLPHLTHGSSLKIWTVGTECEHGLIVSHVVKLKLSAVGKRRKTRFDLRGTVKYLPLCSCFAATSATYLSTFISIPHSLNLCIPPLFPPVSPLSSVAGSQCERLRLCQAAPWPAEQG